jgi:alkylhydroperoxidase family enzyme
MGHSQMLLAVAGLKDDEVKTRVKVLAGGDWGSFPAYERLALRFAAKLSREPARVGKADVDDLIATFGPTRTVDVIWHVAWCNYMTRVADAFQLPLEKENVFAPPQAGGVKKDP